MRATSLTLMGALLAAAVGEAQIGVRPGQYEYTLEMDLSAMGVPKDAQDAVLGAAGFEKEKRLDCITADQVKDMKDPAGIARTFAREADDSNCKISDVRTAGSKLTFTTTCEEDDLRMVTNTEMTFAVDSFTGVSKGKDQKGRTTTMKMSAKRIGECPK